MCALWLVLLFLALSNAKVSVNLRFGTVVGFEDSQANANAFWGIPYAQPPVGDLRFRPTQPWAAEYSGGALDATVNRNTACCQHDMATGAISGVEDCLVLSVFTPREASPSQKRPVLFYIHGGGFVGGSGTTSDIDGRALAAATGSVVVTPNYRLGPMGYFALHELAEESHGTTGNYGVLDQMEALRWVHDNIAAFGGDRHSVLLFGESAGATSSVGLISLRASEGLFNSVVAQSPPYEPHALADAVENSARLAQRLGCVGGEKLLQCLRAADPLSIMGADQGRGGSWGITVDGALFEAEPNELIKAGNFAKVPFVIGNTNNEDNGNIWREYSQPISKGDFPGAAIKMLPSSITENQTTLDTFFELYTPTDGDNRWLLGMLSTDWKMTCPSRRTATAASKWTDVYTYRFFGQPNCSSVPGSLHTDDIMYIFDGKTRDGCTLPATEYHLRDIMRGYWVSTAVSGNPNSYKLKEAPEWPPFLTGLYMGLYPQQPHTIVGNTRDAFCDFWDSL